MEKTGQVDFTETAEIAESAEILLPLPNQTFTFHYDLFPWYKPLIRIFFQISKKSDFPLTFRRFRGFVMQNESAESAEIF